jgi:hypothetical protein
MKLLGISALVLTLLSLVLWLINWVIGTFFLMSYGYNSPVRYVGQTASFLSALAEYLAIGLISIGLMLASKQVVRSEGQDVTGG